MECARLKNWHFVGIGETNDPDWIWMVAMQITDTPFGLSFQENYIKNRDPRIGDMEILLFLSK